MPIDPMDDIELRSVQLQFTNGRGSLGGVCDLRRVETDKGEVLVAVQGDTTKPAILTYHDLGLNCKCAVRLCGCDANMNCSSIVCFGRFHRCHKLCRFLQLSNDARIAREFLCVSCDCAGSGGGICCITRRVNVYKIAIRWWFNGINIFSFSPSLCSPVWCFSYAYPTMEDLANQLLFVLSHFGLKTVIGFGVGSGANVLARFALSHSDKVGALCLINCSSTTSGWMEWGYQSFNARYLRTKGMTQGVVDYLMWHHFGRNPEERNHDLAQVRVKQ